MWSQKVFDAITLKANFLFSIRCLLFRILPVFHGLFSITAIGVTEFKAIQLNVFFNVMLMAHGTYTMLLR